MEIARIIDVSIVAFWLLASVVIVGLIVYAARQEKAKQRNKAEETTKASQGNAQASTVTAAMPATNLDRSIIDTKDHIGFQQRHILATLMMSMFMTNLEPRLQTVRIHMLAVASSVYPQMVPIFESLGFQNLQTIKPGQEKPLVRDIADSEAFFWLCVANVELIQHATSMGDVLRQANQGISEHIFPSDQTIERLWALHDMFVAPPELGDAINSCDAAG